ncbi:MAG: hypothetical protein GY832_23080 [Chloroflexi bacterium]|nr:hypothetical protein [Chloroflexota bacterium]
MAKDNTALLDSARLLAILLACSCTACGGKNGADAENKPDAGLISIVDGGVVDEGPHVAVAIVAASYHSCALTDKGGVKCWGGNGEGMIGNGERFGGEIPTDVVGLTSGVKQLTSSVLHTCALTTKGEVKCWGEHWYGQLGPLAASAYSSLPIDIPGLGPEVTDVSAGAYHSCAVTAGGGVKCWGKNDYGALGDGTTSTSLSPVGVITLEEPMISVAVGANFSCALTAKGEMKCWGGGTHGRLGNGAEEIVNPSPVDVVGLNGNAASLPDSFLLHACILTNEKKIKCWGNNNLGQLGDGSSSTNKYRTTPVDVKGIDAGVVDICVGSTHTCAVTEAGGVKCWGENGFGEVGQDKINETFLLPQDVSGLDSRATAVACGDMHTCALMENGGIKCWGSYEGGRLGDGTATGTEQEECLESGSCRTHIPVDVIGFGAAKE